MECVACVCVWLGAGWGARCWRLVGERIGFGLYQFWRHMGKVGYVSVFWLRWCGWCWGEWMGGLGHGLRGWCGVMSVCVLSLDYLC